MSGAALNQTRVVVEDRARGLTSLHGPEVGPGQGNRNPDQDQARDHPLQNVVFSNPAIFV